MDYSDWAPRDVRALISARQATGPDLRHVRRICPGQPLHFAEGTGL